MKISIEATDGDTGVRSKQEQPNMRTIIAIIFTLSATAALAQQQDRVYYGPDGLRAGSAATHGNQTIYRDSGGRVTGTGTRDSQGTTVYRDAGGRNVSSSRAPRSGPNR